MPDDQPTLRGRARDRAIVRTVLASGALQVSIVLSTLVSLPFVTRALSPAEFGVLATLSGFQALLAFTDLGIGSALTTRVAELTARDDEAGARTAVATACVVAAVVGATVALLGVLSAWVLPWDRILGAQDVPVSAVRLAVVATSLATGLAVPGALGQRLLYAVQRGPSANRWLVVATLSAAVCSVVCSVAGAPLFAFVLAALAVPAVVGTACLGWTVTRTRPSSRPRFADASRHEWSVLRASSGWFFVIAVAAAVGYETDVLVVAAVLGAPQAGVYSICLRVFGLILAALYPGLLQLWPAFADAYVRGDAHWIRTRLVRAVTFVSGTAVAGSAVVLLVGPTFISLWLTEALTPPRSLMWGFAAWTVYSLASAPLFLLMNATRRVRTHALLALSVAVVNLPLSIFLAHQWGLVGPVVGSVVASALVAGIPGLAVTRGLFREPAFVGAARGPSPGARSVS